MTGEGSAVVDGVLSEGDDAQAAMLIPVISYILGFANSFRMMRLPDFAPSEAAEGMLGG